MLPTYHASASRGVATWTARSVHSDHSVIMLTFCSNAALGKLRETDRQHRPAYSRNITPFLTAKEAGPTWGDDSAHLNIRFRSLVNILQQDPRPN